jgi:hypothetical protein
VKKILLYVWQLPQHLLGLLLIKITGACKTNSFFSPAEACVYRQSKYKGWGISLGRYIILHDYYDTDTEYHELGHSVQSVWFGPLYLLAIGIPSALFNNLWDRLFHKKWAPEKRLKWYYSRWPEKQADKLGGVTRDI